MLLVFTAFGFVMFVRCSICLSGLVVFVVIRGWSVGDCAMGDFGCLLVCLFVCGPGLVGGLNCVVLDFGVDLIV